MDLKKEGAINIKLPVINLPTIPKKATSQEAKRINSCRARIVKCNLGAFYTQMMAGLLNEKVSIENPRYVSSYPLFPGNGNSQDSSYSPDILSRNGNFQMEVKAANLCSGDMFYRAGQFAGYCWDFLSNPSMSLYSAIFLFGDSTVKGHRKVRTEDGTKIVPIRAERLHLCRNNKSNLCGKLDCCHGKKGMHIIERLCESTQSLTILPHNFMSFLFVLSNQGELGKGDYSRSHRTKYTGYFKPKISWFKILGRGGSPAELASELYDDEKAKLDKKNKIRAKRLVMAPEETKPLQDLTLNDFSVGNLNADRFQSPPIYVITSSPLRRYRLRQFPITCFSWKSNEAFYQWKTYFSKNRELFLDHLGIKDQYDEHSQAVTNDGIPI